MDRYFIHPQEEIHNYSFFAGLLTLIRSFTGVFFFFFYNELQRN